MEIRSFNAELACANLLFKRQFNNIRIDKTDANGNTKQIVVNCVFGQRSRILKSWQNSERRANIKLPLISINRTGYSRDSSRVNNLHNEVKFEITSKDRIYEYITPVPINIQYEVTVMSKFQSDIDQIASNFMIFFNSSIYVSCIHPKYDGIKMNNQIIMDDQVSEDHPDELDGGTDDFITSTFTFTFKTFLFAGMTQAKKKPQMILSSFLSSFDKYETFQFRTSDQAIKFLEGMTGNQISVVIANNVSEQVTSYVENGEISDYVYDEFAPIIRQIDVGFYPVPMVCSIVNTMSEIEKIDPKVSSPVQGYISSQTYLSSYETYFDDNGAEQQRLSNVIPEDFIYEDVTTSSIIYPYCDRLIWQIDAQTANDFADNVYVFRNEN